MPFSSSRRGDTPLRSTLLELRALKITINGKKCELQTV